MLDEVRQENVSFLLISFCRRKSERQKEEQTGGKEKTFKQSFFFVHQHECKGTK
jgi:hypothetical protein